MLALVLLLPGGASAKTATSATAPPGREIKKAAKVVGCLSVNRAIIYYRSKTWGYESKLAKITGKNSQRSRTTFPERKKDACAYKRKIAKVWRARASDSSKAIAKWEYNYAWWKWLPDKWQRIGACETGYGKRPGNFHWDSGRFVSAFGIYRAGYTQYAHEIGLPGWDEGGVRTPHEQYMVALRIYSHYGYGAWGCGGA